MPQGTCLWLTFLIFAVVFLYMTQLDFSDCGKIAYIGVHRPDNGNLNTFEFPTQIPQIGRAHV